MSFPSRSGEREAGRRAPLQPDRGQGGAAAFNTLVTCILIAILISTGMAYYLQVIRRAREVALQSELVNLRMAILLFTINNRRFPASLQELVGKKYLLPNEEFSIAADKIVVERRSIYQRSYLETSSVDAEGRILDPFGNPYRYDPRRGQVMPTEEEYAFW